MTIKSSMQETNFLRQLLSDFQCSDRKSVILYADNQGAISLAKNPVHHQRSKHIDIKYHFIRSEVQYGIVDLQYIKSDDNITDIFTKPVSKNKLLRVANIRGLL